MDRYDEANLFVFKIKNSPWSRRTSENRKPIISQDQQSIYQVNKQRGVISHMQTTSQSKKQPKTPDQREGEGSTSKVILFEPFPLCSLAYSSSCYPEKFFCRTPSLMPSFLRELEKEGKTAVHHPVRSSSSAMPCAGRWKEGRTDFCMYQPRPVAMQFCSRDACSQCQVNLGILFTRHFKTKSMLSNRDAKRKGVSLLVSVRPDEQVRRSRSAPLTHLKCTASAVSPMEASA